MTANAMQGDREACLAAGMQDHVAKPIDPDDLWRALLKWIVPGRPPAAAADAVAPAAASPPADDDVLPGDVAGIDLALGLQHAAGRKALYVALLRKFVAGQADAVPAVERALAAGDTAGAQRLAHTLKGTAATIGAVALAQSAERLEAALGGAAAREVLDALLADLAPSLARVVAALRAAVPAPTAGGGTEAIDTARLKAVVARLTARLADSDAEANDIFAQNAGLLRSALGERYAQLEQALDAYDFDRALGTLEAALTTLGRPA
jgi:two-component system sensor histidine kinase/response regulator